MGHPHLTGSISFGLNLDSGQSVQDFLAGKHIVVAKVGKGGGWVGSQDSRTTRDIRDSLLGGLSNSRVC